MRAAAAWPVPALLLLALLSGGYGLWVWVMDALSAQGVGFDVVTVPGALEVPTVIAMADEAVHIGPAPAAQSYLVADKIVEAVRRRR